MNTSARILAAFVSYVHLHRQKETEKFDKSTNDLANNYLRVSNISALLSPATTLIMNVGIICLLTVGGIKVNIGSLQQGQVLALINYMNQMLLALIVVSNLVVIFTRAEASGNRVKEVLDTENSILEAEISTTPDFSSESILAFDHVDFRYTPDSGLSSRDYISAEAKYGPWNHWSNGKRENDFDSIDSALL